MRIRQLLLPLLLLLLLTGCGSAWQAEVSPPAGGTLVVDARYLQGLSRFAEAVDGQNLVPVERVLAGAGYEVVATLTVVEPGGARHDWDWAGVAEQSWWLPDGALRIAGDRFPVARLEVTPSPLLAQVTVRLTDVAPTIAAALGLPAPAQATGKALAVPPASRAVLLFLDGFGYLRYQEALQQGLIPNLAALGTPQLGLTVYPPVTTVASAALLTGAPPAVNGVEVRSTRKTDAETLLDVATAAGRRVVAVEGDSLAFNLRGADPRLSGDRDGNGSTDDNVLANALAAMQEGIPDLLWVHFHGIDDTGHTYGPGAAEERACIAEVDRAVGTLLQALPPGTLVVILADHGMHPVQEAGRLGNHGHMIERDMFIPIWVLSR